MSGPSAAGGGDDGTPLTSQERNGLIPSHIVLHSELNELEQRNIAEATGWALARKRNVLKETFLKTLHRRMFGRVWRWAGDYRTSERNLGVAPFRIQMEILQVIDDTRYWIEHETYERDEVAVRFHHRLVAIHPFPNGNGRWSRLAADVLVVQRGAAPFSWGSIRWSRTNLQSAGDIRRTYIDALQAADRHDIKPLVAFARS